MPKAKVAVTLDSGLIDRVDRLVKAERFPNRSQAIEIALNERSGTVIAVAITSQEPRAGFPLTLESQATGLTKRSWIKISQVRTLSTDRIGKRIARAPDGEVAKVIDGLNELIAD